MRLIPALIALAGLAACAPVVPSAPEPTPPPPPVAPPPPPPPPPASSDWRDWPLTPGNWTYQPLAQGSIARFGNGSATVFAMRCDRGSRQIIVTRSGTAANSMTVRTSTTARTVAGNVDGGTLTVSLPARDGLLDAMGYSRGRFIVETMGQPPLVIPSWAEVQRVTEDCRR